MSVFFADFNIQKRCFMGSKNIFAVTLIAADRPGIVAAVSKVFFENDFNIEDSSSTLLQGFFSAIFIVSKEGVDADDVKGMFAELEKNMNVDINVQGMNEAGVQPVGEHYIISVYGSDKPGIVNKVAQYLSDNKINIVDLQTKVAGSDESPIYLMVLEVVIESDMENSTWEDDIKKISRDLGTDVNIRQIETYEF
jgi:glycine cleavage system transcriptional repressor